MVRGQFPACAACASLELRWISNTEGPVGWGAELDMWVCRKCGYRGQAIEFADEASWQAFAESKKAEPGPADA